MCIRDSVEVAHWDIAEAITNRNTLISYHAISYYRLLIHGKEG